MPLPLALAPFVPAALAALEATAITLTAIIVSKEGKDAFDKMNLEIEKSKNKNITAVQSCSNASANEMSLPEIMDKEKELGEERERKQQQIDNLDEDIEKLDSKLEDNEKKEQNSIENYEKAKKKNDDRIKELEQGNLENEKEIEDIARLTQDVTIDDKQRYEKKANEIQKEIEHREELKKNHKKKLERLKGERKENSKSITRRKTDLENSKITREKRIREIDKEIYDLGEKIKKGTLPGHGI